MVSERVERFFADAPEPEGSLHEIFDRAEHDAARRMDPMLPDRQTRSDRANRYAEVAVDALDLNVLRAQNRMVADAVAARFMALASAEQAELRARNLEMAERHSEHLHNAIQRAEAAEARVARVEALHDKWASARNISDGRPNPVLIGISAMLRAAMDGE